MQRRYSITVGGLSSCKLTLRDGETSRIVLPGDMSGKLVLYEGDRIDLVASDTDSSAYEIRLSGLVSDRQIIDLSGVFELEVTTESAELNFPVNLKTDSDPVLELESAAIDLCVTRNLSGNIRADVSAGLSSWIKPDQNLVYAMGKTWFDGSNYVNTGVDLQSYPEYTVLVDFKLDSVSEGGNVILDNMREEDPWPGWTLEYNKWGELRFSDTTAQLRKIANNLSRNRIVIRRRGSAYTVFAQNIPNGQAGNVLEEDIGHPLYVGAYYNLGDISRFMVGAVYSLTIYGTAWSDADCKAWRTDAGSISVRRTFNGSESAVSAGTSTAKISAEVFTVLTDWINEPFSEIADLTLDKLIYKEV